MIILVDDISVCSKNHEAHLKEVLGISGKGRSFSGRKILRKLSTSFRKGKLIPQL